MKLLPFLLALMLAFAGCLDEDDPADDDTDTDPGDSDPVGPRDLEESWYLHDVRPACDNDNPANYILTQELTEANDQDGCGSIGLAASGFTMSYAGQSNSTGFNNGTLALSIWVSFADPGPHTVSVALKSGGATVFSDSLEQTYTGAAAAGQTIEYAFSGPLDATVDFGSKFTLDVTITGGSYFMGYGPDNPSGFTITPS